MKLKKLLKANLTPIRKVIIKQGIHAIAFDYDTGEIDFDDMYVAIDLRC